MVKQTSIITIKQLIKTYGSTIAVNNLNLDINKGEVFGLLGPNGAGKTTTIEMIEGLRLPDSGKITIFGMNHKDDGKKIRQKIGVQMQTSALYPRLTVKEIVKLFSSFFDGKTVATKKLLEELKLTGKANCLSSKLSGGQQQRLNVALSLVNNPEVIFLDEPTAGMDPQARHNVWDIIAEKKRGGKTIILSTHFMDEAQQLCDRIAIMNQGKIIELGSPRQIINKYIKDSVIEITTNKQSGFNNLPAVSDVKFDDHTVYLHSNNIALTLSALTSNIDQSKLKSINVRSATLEDVFIKLTGRALRD